MPDTIVLYVTRGGRSRSLALDLGKRLGAQVAEIGDLVKRKGVFGFIKSGRQAATGQATPIQDPRVDLGPASAIVLVEPVWAGSVCPPMRSYIRAHIAELAGKRIALLASAAGGDDGKLRAKFESEFGGDLGSLAAFAIVPQGAGEAARERALDGFAKDLLGK
jgi:hypothetical protein